MLNNISDKCIQDRDTAYRALVEQDTRGQQYNTMNISL